VVVAVVAAVVVVAGSAITAVIGAVAAESFAVELVAVEVTSDVPAPAPKLSVPPELAVVASELGQAWAQNYVHALRGQEREIVGAWPGTLREARRHVLARVKQKLEPELLDQLARLTNLAARRGWESVSEPDLES